MGHPFRYHRSIGEGHFLTYTCIYIYIERTNVYKFSQALIDGTVIDSKGHMWEQVHTYFSGVGTSQYHILGGLFGYGISKQIKSAYSYLCRNYRDERDEIWLIGFSRGGKSFYLFIYFCHTPYQRS